MEFDEKKYGLAFNKGYDLAEKYPKLMKEYKEAVLSGIEQYFNTRVKEKRMEELGDIEKGKGKSKGLER